MNRCTYRVIYGDTDQMGVVYYANYLAFFERGPQSRVTHDDGVDHAEGVERELVLTQDTDLFRARDVAFRWLEFARQDLHQRRFPGAVRPGDRIAATRLEGDGDIVKQDTSAVAHGDVGQ